jgi:hypothetical protein
LRIILQQSSTSRFTHQQKTIHHLRHGLQH